MQKENIHTAQAPNAIGPYTQAVRVGDLIYTAGQGGLEPVTGKMVDGDVQAQTEQAMQNLSAVLEAAGSDLDHVIKTNIYLRYIKDFDAMNEVYAQFFENQFPARTTVATSALPMAALVEIEMVAVGAEATEVAKDTEGAEAAKEVEVAKETEGTEVIEVGGGAKAKRKAKKKKKSSKKQKKRKK